MRPADRLDPHRLSRQVPVASEARTVAGRPVVPIEGDGLATTTTQPAARAVGVRKIYGVGDAAVEALRGVSLDFTTGEWTAIMGPSGSGKSTLLHVLAGLDTPTDGRVFIGDVDLTTLNDKQLTQLRRDRIGFVFQAYNLIPTLTAEENITLPLDIAGRDVDRGWFDQVIDTVGLRDRLRHRPSELSGGQQQRVAVARALASKPTNIFADEPTGNLDSRSGAELLEFLGAAVHDHGQTIVMVTHDAHAAAHAQRVVFLADGNAVHEMGSPTADAILDEIKSLEG
jgi:putative ABC transport system ATP-binding protein